MILQALHLCPEVDHKYPPISDFQPLWSQKDGWIVTHQENNTLLDWLEMLEITR